MQKTRFVHIMLFAFFFLSTGLSLDAQAITDQEKNNEKEFTQLWESRLKEVDILELEASEITAQFEILHESSNGVIKKAQSSADNLLSLYKVSSRLPSEQLVFVYQMQRLEANLRQAIIPLSSMAANIEQNLATIDSQYDNISEILDKPSVLQGSETIEKNALLQARQRLKTTGNSLTATRNSLKRMLSPAEELAARLTETIEHIHKDMPDVWMNYYKAKAGMNISMALKSSTSSTWLSSLSSRLIFTVPHSAADWYDVGKSFAMGVLFFSFFSGILAHLVLKLPLQQREFLKKYGTSSLLWIGLGVGISAAAFDEQGGIYLSFMVGGALVLVWGVVTLGWRLRWAVNPSLKNKISPLAQMFPVALFGILLLQSDTPPSLLCFIWFVVMLAFGVFVYSITWRHLRGDVPQPSLEQFVYVSSFVVSAISLAVTVAGYTRLAILAFIFLIAITNFIILGFSITSFFGALIDRYYNHEEHPVKNSMVQVCNVPVSWFLAFCFSLPWVWAVPGSIFIINYMMYTGYTFGGTSFDFAKILYIVLLFVLFRSFTSLASSSLVLIGKRLSHIEEGVIPPLQNIVTYALWAIFGLIALATFGVSLTSIAVIAGGLSVGIGFGLQNIFNNLVSGIVLIFGRTVLVGDYIEVDGIVGTVRAISIRSTSIETTEMALVYVPNSVIMSGNVTNWTRNTRKVRRSVSITIPVDRQFEDVATILIQIAHEQKHVVAFIEPTVQLMHLGIKTMTVSLTVVVDDLSNASSTLSDIREAIQKSFFKPAIDMG